MTVFFFVFLSVTVAPTIGSLLKASNSYKPTTPSMPSCYSGTSYLYSLIYILFSPFLRVILSFIFP
jgi:hypothetical protein